MRGHAMENLGRVYLEIGQPHQAIASLSQAHRLHVASGDLRGQAMTLKLLGRAQHDAGQDNRARTSLSAAFGLFERLKLDAETTAIHATLATLTVSRP
jgi:hypothetical protein